MKKNLILFISGFILALLIYFVNIAIGFNTVISLLVSILIIGVSAAVLRKVILRFSESENEKVSMPDYLIFLGSFVPSAIIISTLV